MTEEQSSELREEIAPTFAEEGFGPLDSIGGLLLAIMILAASAALLSLLRKSSKKVSIPPAGWGFSEVALAFGSWYFLQFTMSAVVFLAFPPLPPSAVSRLLEHFSRLQFATPAQILGGAASGLIVAAGILSLPRILGQPMSVLGLGTGSLRAGAFQGFLVWLCSLPGLLTLTVLWLYVLTILGLSTDQQQIVQVFRTSLLIKDYLPVVMIVFLAGVVAPIIEELLFRVVLFRWLERQYGATIAITSSGLIFGLIHGSLFSLLPISILGMILAALFHRTGNLWSCIALHAAFNVGQLSLMMSLAM